MGIYGVGCDIGSGSYGFETMIPGMLDHERQDGSYLSDGEENDVFALLVTETACNMHLIRHTMLGSLAMDYGKTLAIAECDPTFRCYSSSDILPNSLPMPETHSYLRSPSSPMYLADWSVGC